MKLWLTQPCAELRALLLSEFVSLFFIRSLTYLIFFMVSACRRCLSVLDRYTPTGRSSTGAGSANTVRAIGIDLMSQPRSVRVVVYFSYYTVTLTL